MGRGSRGSGQNALRRSVDLTGIISLAERNDLVSLVTAITEKLHSDLETMFDSPPVRPQDPHPNSHYQWLSLSLSSSRNEINKESVSTGSKGRRRGKYARAQALKTVQRVAERQTTASLTPQLRELKKEASAFFRKWQSAVLQRLREIGVNDATISSPGLRGRGRGPRGTCRGIRGGRGERVNQGSLTLATGQVLIPSHQIDPDLASKYCPLPNPLWALTLEKRKLLLHIVLLVLISFQEYNANGRLLILHLTVSLNLPKSAYEAGESRVARGLAEAVLELSAEEDRGRPKSEDGKSVKNWKLDGTSAGGQSVSFSTRDHLQTVSVGTSQSGFGLTSIAASGLLGSMAENKALIGALFGINSARPIYKMLEIFLREIQDFAFLRLIGKNHWNYCDARDTVAGSRRLRVILAMSGCIKDDEDVVRPWRQLGSHSEVYAVKWETAALKNLGGALETVIKSSSWESAEREIASRTIFQSLMDFSWPATLLKISKIIDNPWNVGMVRAEKAGTLMADALIRHKFQGERPVSLIGYSLAARAVYTCLMVLAERRQFGLIDSVVMVGAPAPSESRVWQTLKSVVSGRLVNVYSEHDYILGFLYRTSNIQFGVAGLQEIQGADGIENYHIETLPKGHLSYQSLMVEILRDIAWDDLEMRPSGAAKPLGPARSSRQNM